MTVRFHSAFKKRYQKAPIHIRRQFDERLILFQKDYLNPLLNLHPLIGDRKGQFSINITGDWRALFIFHDVKMIIFIDLNTHSNLYG